VLASRLAIRLDSRLGRRLLLGLAVGIGAFVAIELIQLFAFEVLGFCTGCSVEGQPGVLGGVALGGGAASLGGGGDGGLDEDDDGSDDDDRGRNRFDRWLDNVLGGGPPAKSVEGVEPPSAAPAPADPEAERQALEDAKEMLEFYKRVLGSKGVVDMPEGSTGAEYNAASDRFFDFASGQTDVGPSDGGSGDD
jgi:hypothetical protein